MKRFAFCAAMCLLAVFSLGGGSAALAQSKDEQEIRALEDKFAAAFSAKDAAAVMKLYTPGNDLVIFDVIPPRQYVGWDAYKKDFESTFAGIKGPMHFDIRDLSITAEGKLAYSHSIQHVAWANPDGSPAEMTVRVTDVYRKIDGKWLIVHEHVSVPVDMSTGKPIPDMMSKP
jgi:uncharacterized protein (TIGR02246 family)